MLSKEIETIEEDIENNSESFIRNSLDDFEE